MKEFVLWAMPANSRDRLDEQVMTSTVDLSRIDKIKIIAAKAGWHSFRVQVIDGEIPCFVSAVSR